MKTTISDIRAQISTLERDQQRLQQLASNSVVISKIRELNGQETVMSTVENYDDIMKNIHEHIVEIARLKGLVHKLNCETKLADGRSIAEVIAYLAGIRIERNLLSRARDSREQVRRRADGGLNGSAYYDVTELNFKKEDVDKRYKELTEEINALESEINRLNSLEVEIDD